MKYTLLSIAFIISLNLNAQNNEGVIIYEDKMNIHKRLPPEMEAMKSRIPEFRTNKKMLYFNSEATLYKNPPKDETKEEEQEFRGEGRGRRGRRWRGGGDNIYYTDLSTKNSIDSREFFGKKFLINGEKEKLAWKLTGKQKQVGSFLCQEAVHSDSLRTTKVWFTPMIPVSAGPDDYTGLPGLILHVDINDGERQITAMDIKLEALTEENKIVKPTEGKAITREEFNKMRDEKNKEMEEEFGNRRGGPWGRRNR